MNIVDDTPMCGYEEKAQLLRILSHPARLQILDILRKGEECVCHIQAVLDKRQAYVSQQMMVLREAGLVTDRKVGLNVLYRLVDPATNDMLSAILGPAETRVYCDEAACPRCHSVDQDAHEPARQSRN